MKLYRSIDSEVSNVSDERFDRIENLLTQLIGNVASMRSGMDDLRTEVAGQFQSLELKVSELKDTMIRVEHKVNVLERRQDKMGSRLDTMEAELELIQDEKQ
ncbi:MAG: hypothetical protein A2201_07600 [Alicyclobacillus sp. RIFOXYA1_FULL_53_8]|nr:MAG: hypothetical protein A2201_07600 [Alicyclobacillus sp. RIFOXYA1_FULL_53_8]